MTTTPPSESSSSPTEPAAAERNAAAEQSAAGAAPGEASSGLPAKFAKGCGCSLVVILLAIGVAMMGDSEPASIGSALVGVVILVVVWGSSGLVGWWNDK
jgi:hypothetical protein